MWQFLLGCGTGIYIGTYYDCKPAILYVHGYLKKQFPDQFPKKKD